MSHEPLEDFVEASSLSRVTASAFGARLRSFDDTMTSPAPLIGTATLQPLQPVDDELQQLLSQRRSTRSFRAGALDASAVAAVLASVGASEGRRLIPSAGGLSCVSTYGIAHAIEGPGAGTVFRYDAATHSVQAVTDAPSASELGDLFLLDAVGTPQLILVFVAELDRVVAKYGPRSARFAIQEAGHAAQNIGLRAARAQLAAYVLGGALDKEVLDLLGVGHLRVMLAGSMAVGLAPSTRDPVPGAP